MAPPSPPPPPVPTCINGQHLGNRGKQSLKHFLVRPLLSQYRSIYFFIATKLSRILTIHSSSPLPPSLTTTTTMVVLSKPTLSDFPPIINCKSTTLFPVIPTVDLSEPDSKHLVVKSCEEFGFFKVINHGIPLELISRLETEVIEFFSLSLSEKQKAGPPDPFGYGNRSIGPNGDVGWVEYLLLTMNQERNSQKLATIFGKYPEKLW